MKLTQTTVTHVRGEKETDVKDLVTPVLTRENWVEYVDTLVQKVDEDVSVEDRVLTKNKVSYYGEEIDYHFRIWF